jgi:predicted house-cleaning noncanonical NTP pyrophosphatase (MazG superfamily)
MTIYNKLVRDKIPEIIAAKGEKALTRIASESELRGLICAKLREEVEELIADQTITECADVLEVMQTLIKAFGYTHEEVELVRKKRVVDRGGFEKRIVLLES